ncbi:methylated-DNA--[protein]-cysteine S-methyltransferase [Halobacillus sp. B23F22_1]|uniref:methylated-DNA--[protein]-cysteine S-methyltransferase n=1 Tax=Halobacillus sp. B23F22_1 TaxID=3459514 RepID=UPI00373E1F6B
MEIYKENYSSPLGNIEIKSTDYGIISVQFVEDFKNSQRNRHIEDCIRQLDEYFKKERRTFSLNLSPHLSNFQKKVLDDLSRVSFGHTTNYSQIARAIGQPTSIRAVGNAIGKNPIAIIIPCHRVIGKNNDLRGYAWGKWRKEELLKFEQLT